MDNKIEQMTLVKA